MTTWVITGSRRGHPQVETVLEYMSGFGGLPSCVVVGDATGVDEQAAEWARKHEVIVATFKANWRELGAKAGPERNAQMVEFAQRGGNTAWCLGFPDSESIGTWDCLRKAWLSDFERVEYWSDIMLCMRTMDDPSLCSLRMAEARARRKKGGAR